MGRARSLACIRGGVCGFRRCSNCLVGLPVVPIPDCSDHHRGVGIRPPRNTVRHYDIYQTLCGGDAVREHSVVRGPVGAVGDQVRTTTARRPDERVPGPCQNGGLDSGTICAAYPMDNESGGAVRPQFDANTNNILCRNSLRSERVYCEKNSRKWKKGYDGRRSGGLSRFTVLTDLSPGRFRTSEVRRV